MHAGPGGNGGKFNPASALAGAAILPTLSKSARADDDGGDGGDRHGHRCMLRGTRILTSRGAERVESLSVGDIVVTARGEARPIKWIGRQHFTQGLSSR